jgi:hypothetical protein
MIQDTVEGLRVEQRMETAAANEEFTGTVTHREIARREGGWDPYEVWLTRVKERRREPRESGKTRDPRR